MGELIMEPLDSPWTLTVVENSGEVPAHKFKDEVVVPTEPLLSDIKTQLSVVPRTLSYTVGWRAVVWQNKESGAFLDLTEKEFDAYINGNIVTFTRGSEQDVKEDEGTNGDAAGDSL